MFHKIIVQYFSISKNQQKFNDSIFALASGQTKAGVSIIRISGFNSLQAYQFIQKENFEKLSNEQIQEKYQIQPRYAYFKNFYSILDKNKQIDKGIFIYFQGPKSYTGEDVVEFHIHGSRALQRKILYELSKINQFRLADQGEFTKRALINNKLDLMEVEGLADLLNSETEIQRQQSTNQFLGKSSQILENWRFELIKALSNAEAFIDFESDQDDVEFNILSQTQEQTQKILNEIKNQLNNKNKGEIIRDGIKISIIGKPNSGKSTLLNCLAKKEIAIVSEIPGTTRDILSVVLNISGFPVILYDTAGIRTTIDKIEEKGVNRAIQQAKESDIIILIVDIEDIDDKYQINIQQNEQLFQIIDNEKYTVLTFINKIDLKENKIIHYIKIFDKEIPVQGYISAQNNTNINNLIDILSNTIQKKIEFQNDYIIEENSIITQSRHRIELEKCMKHLEVFCFNQNNLQADLVCEELRYAVNSIGKITGRVDVEEVLDVLFKEFCIGK
ncbi:tRNA modification gtpase, putative [Ichthyophthirius multifiliis]|uniref:tRNA modification gtpase, putative n=1 Tax=Ichthyophthirius multifiliis TaxID=5932 RepID=G0QX59_ICHMU|nr:tRNA modification gtpase, putative [Ichthyophthirius multifiliis]EGR30197.1 tRNA modification gtpase, putative [Ichthyophthirius multifiliis]|eukprot:XP_004031793.1 tRNA modification gtpase, putative [Ichthyophthirius multifiliis]